MGEGSDDDIKRTFARLTQNMSTYDDLRAAIGTFLTNFAVFESLYLSAALKALSSDPVVIEYLAELMPVESRLKLLRHLCRAYAVPKALTDDVNWVFHRANDLRNHRNEIAHGAAVFTAAGTDYLADPDETSWVPGVRRPLSKRGIPADSEDVLNLAAVHTAPRIRAWAADAEALQISTEQLAVKLAAWRNGGPWETMTVGRAERVSPSIFGAEEPKAG